MHLSIFSPTTPFQAYLGEQWGFDLKIAPPTGLLAFENLAVLLLQNNQVGI